MRASLLLGFALIATVATTPALARRVATDTEIDPATGQLPGYDSPGCTLDGSISCTAYNLGFSVQIGGVRTNKIYLYDDGMVSFGVPASGGFGANSVATNLRDPAHNEYGYEFWRVAFFDRSADNFTVRWTTCASPGSFNTDCFYTGDVYLRIDHNPGLGRVNVSLDIEDYKSGFTSDLLTDLGAQYGYDIDGQVQALAPLDNNAVLSFTLNTGVPEPASWAMLLTGFGLAGTALRRQRRRAVAA